MNRDERRDRAPEVPPRVHPAAPGGVAWAGPADGERGGTWIGVNEHGMVACLLNGFRQEDLAAVEPDDAPSRGQIVPEILSRTPADAWDWTERGLDPAPYPSFTLLLVSARDAFEVSWRRGDHLRRRPLGTGWTMVSSSSWRSAEVQDWRMRRFSEWRQAGAAHVNGVPAFNLLDEPGRREWAPLMTRSTSATRSLTEARVDLVKGRAALRWWLRIGDSAIDPSRPHRSFEVPLQGAAEGPS